MAKRQHGVASPTVYFIFFILFSPLVVSVKFSSKYSASQKVLNTSDKIITNVSGNFKTLVNKNNKTISDDSNKWNRLTVNNMSNSDLIGGSRGIKLFDLVSDCIDSEGVGDCLKIFLLRRLQGVKSLINADPNVTIAYDDIRSEILKSFKWEEYKRKKEGALDVMLLNDLNDVLQNRSTKLFLMPGIDLGITHISDRLFNLKFRSKGVQEFRGHQKKMLKMLYTVVPFLLIPALIMTAIIPFFLPTLKMLVILSGIINQVALTGSLFTLIRNNIFRDDYNKKEVYINHGYKNEHMLQKQAHKSHTKDNLEHEFHENLPYHYDSSLLQHQLGASEFSQNFDTSAISHRQKNFEISHIPVVESPTIQNHNQGTPQLKNFYISPTVKNYNETPLLKNYSPSISYEATHGGFSEKEIENFELDAMKSMPNNHELMHDEFTNQNFPPYFIEHVSSEIQNEGLVRKTRKPDHNDVLKNRQHATKTPVKISETKDAIHHFLGNTKPPEFKYSRPMKHVFEIQYERKSSLEPFLQNKVHENLKNIPYVESIVFNGQKETSL